MDKTAAKDEQTLDRLEDALGKLMRSHDELKRENAALATALGDKEREAEALRAQVERLGREKGAVKDRVDVLLGRIEGLI